jgi:PAS domain S-box-containing protein
MHDTQPIQVLLICDQQYDIHRLQTLAQQSPYQISLDTSRLDNDIELNPVENFDVVLLDLAGLQKKAINPAELGDTLFCHAPVVLVGSERISTQAMEGVHAGAADWLVEERLAECCLHGFLEQARQRYLRQRQLIMSQALYQSVVEDQDHLVCRYLFDAQCTVTFVNAAYARHRCESVNALQGTSILEKMSPSEQASFVSRLCALTPAYPSVVTDCYVETEYDAAWIQWTDKALFDSNGYIIEVQSVGVDITARRCAEQRALDNESRFERLFDQVPLMLLQLDLKGRIVSVNQQWQSLSGYKVDELIGLHFYRCIHTSSRTAVRENLQVLNQQGWIKDVPCRLKRQNDNMDMSSVALSASIQYDSIGKPESYIIACSEHAQLPDKPAVRWNEISSSEPVAEHHKDNSATLEKGNDQLADNGNSYSRNIKLWNQRIPSGLNTNYRPVRGR